MKTMLSVGAVLALVVASVSPAMATDTAINPASPLGGTPGSVQSFLDSLVPFGQTFTRVSDGGDNVWVATAGTVDVTFLGAGYSNGFGVVSGATGGSYTQLFVSPSGYGGQPFVPNADFDLNGLGDPSQFEFRFALNSDNRYPGLPGTLYTSKPSDNIDGEDHMVTWKITSGAFAGSYIIGFEDLSYNIDGWNDHDYEDMILFVSGAAPKAVPEPGTIVLLGSGLMGLLAYSRRRKLQA